MERIKRLWFDRYGRTKRLVESSESLWGRKAHTLYVQYDSGMLNFMIFRINFLFIYPIRTGDTKLHDSKRWVIKHMKQARPVSFS